MKVIVAGSRSVSDYRIVRNAIIDSGYDITEIVSGRAKGADTLGEQYASIKGLDLKMFPANWERYGKRAGPLRNTAMADYADAAIVIWDGSSPGTKNMIDQMKERNKPVKICLTKP